MSEFSIERLLGHTRVLSEQFPHRHTGERQQQQAAAYIATQLRQSGLTVHEIETPVLGWEVVRTPTLEVLAPRRFEIECAPYVYSGSTPEGGIEGRLRAIGPTFGPGSIPWQKYAVVDKQDRWQALIVARPDGPAMSRRGTPAGSGITADGPSYSWPSCIIGQKDGTLLADWLSDDVPVRLRYEIETRHKPNCTSVNVQGILHGSADPEDVIIFGVHHDAAGAIGFPDSVDSPGANDNASGVAIMIETARLLAERGTRKTVWFCSFDGEERNLMGSSDFVRTLNETGNLDRVVAYVGIDQAAYGDRFWVLASADAPHLEPQLNMQALAQDVIDRLDVEERAGVANPAPLHAASDHWPFYYAGVPAILTGWHPFPGYHRAGDTFESCTNDEQFLVTADVTLELLRAVLNQPVLGPVARPLNAGYVLSPPVVER